MWSHAAAVAFLVVPELPEVELVRRELEPVLTGARFDAVELRRSNLRIPFPPDFIERLVGQTVTGVTRRAKYLLVALSSGETLLVHLGMTGGFRVARQRVTGGYRAAEDTDDPKHDHVVFEMTSGTLVTFNDPRRFGLMDLVPRGGLPTHPVLGRLGPEPLSAEFDAAALAAACAGKTVPLKLALLDQRVVAGLGNIYVSEALFIARLSPKRRSSTIATPTGRPRATAVRLAAAIVQVLEAALGRSDMQTSRFRVYERTGTRCPRRGCGGTVAQIVQGARSTYYCPTCQR